MDMAMNNNMSGNSMNNMNMGYQQAQVSPMGTVDMTRATTPSVTTVQDLEAYASGTIVQLPEFGEGQPFIARMRRPSLLALVKQGKIPNSLLISANELFQSGVGSYDSDNQDSLKQIFDVIDIIIEASLIQPSYAQIKTAGIELTDEQRIAIFSYSQQGIRALESFR